MASNNSPLAAKNKSQRTLNGILLVLSILTSAIAWWMIAWPAPDNEIQ